MIVLEYSSARYNLCTFVDRYIIAHLFRKFDAPTPGFLGISFEGQVSTCKALFRV